MYIMKVYIPLKDLSKIIKNNLTDEAKVQFNNFDFVPINLHINENDMSIEALAVPTPKIAENNSTMVNL